MVVKAFRDKCHPLGDKRFEWCVYHGLKWCLSPSSVLIIQSEEELPAHYLVEKNNVSTRLSTVSSVRGCQLQQRSFTLNELQDSLLVLHHHHLTLPPRVL